MNTHPFDVLALENDAKLIFTPCPGTKETTIESALATLKSAGVSMLVTLMYDTEMEKYHAHSLSSACQAQGLIWVQLPMPDDAAPNQDFEQQWQQHRLDIIDVLNNKGTIAVHCKGGSGRTALAISLILRELGWSDDNIITAVQQIRPKALKHPVQLEYFTSRA